MVKKINHIAIVVDDINTAVEFWRDKLGIELSHIEDVPSQHAKVAFLPLGDSEVELVQPIDENSGLAKFLNTRGPGMHHICFEVDDIEATLEDLINKGVRLINQSPVLLENRKIVFIHPKSANGVLIELYEDVP